MTKAGLVSILKWIVTRTGFWYLILFAVILCLVDMKGLSERLKISRMNYLRPISFSEFTTYALKGGTVPDLGPYRRYFELVLSYMPDEPVSRLALGYVKFQQGQLKEAQADLLSSWRLNPALFWNGYCLGVMAFQRGEYSLAEKYLMQALRVPPEVVVRMMEGSIVYRQILWGLSGQYRMLDQVVAAQSDATILLLANYLKGGQPQAALSMARSLLDQGKIRDFAPVYFYAGRAALELGQIPVAVELLDRSLQLDLKNPMIYAYLAEIAAKAGQKDRVEGLKKKADALAVQFADRYPYERMIHLRIF